MGGVKLRQIRLPWPNLRLYTLAMPKTLAELKEERYHLWWVLNHIDLTEDARTLFQSLLAQIDDKIMSAQKPN